MLWQLALLGYGVALQPPLGRRVRSLGGARAAARADDAKTGSAASMQRALGLQGPFEFRFSRLIEHHARMNRLRDSLYGRECARIASTVSETGLVLATSPPKEVWFSNAGVDQNRDAEVLWPSEARGVDARRGRESLRIDAWSPARLGEL